MPAPFPGMDPYLENSPIWGDFHNSFLVYLRDAIQPLLPEPYVATIELRIVLDRGDGGNGRRHERLPDLEVLRSRSTDCSPRGTGAALLAPPEPELGVWVEHPISEIREAYVSVFRLPDRDLITSIELLSPANKTSGPARSAYLRKQRHLLDGNVNLVELDFLRGGRHTVAVPADRLAALPHFHYLICTWRAARPDGFHILPWTVRDPLPPLRVPLDPEIAEVTVPLQPLLDRAYDAGRYHRLLQCAYLEEPRPRLHGEDRVWARECLHAAGPGPDGHPPS